MGDALGHSWVGLLLARAIDPALQTPVPLAFTYKLLVSKGGREGGREGGKEGRRDKEVYLPTGLKQSSLLPFLPSSLARRCLSSPARAARTTS